MSVESYAQRLKSRYNNPPHSRLVDAQTTLSGINEPKLAWNRLLQSGLIPDDFVKVKDRRYSEAENAECLWPTDRPPENSYPRSMYVVLAIGANARGMIKAEQHAQEFAKRLFPWNAMCNNRIVWYFTTNTYEVSYLGKPYESARDSVGLTLESHGLDPMSYEVSEDVSQLPILVQRALRACNGWKQAVNRNFKLTEPKWIDLSKWKYFSDVENPFEPLFELWCTGYRIVCPFDDEDSTIRLYANTVSVEAGSTAVE